MTRLSDEAVAAKLAVIRSLVNDDWGLSNDEARLLLADRAALVAEVKEWEEVAIKNAGDALDWEGKHYRLNEQFDRLAAERRADAERVRVLTAALEPFADESRWFWSDADCGWLLLVSFHSNSDEPWQEASAALAVTPPPGPA